LDRVWVSGWGNAAARLNNVTCLTIRGCSISDAVYAGIITTTATDGLIEGCAIERIGVQGASANANNAYGISLSRWTSQPAPTPVQVGSGVDGFLITSNTLRGNGTGVSVHVIGPCAVGKIAAKSASEFDVALSVELGNTVATP